jgi:cytochrome c oxidase subunit 4
VDVKPNDTAVPDVRRYLLVFAALLVLTLATAAVSGLGLGPGAMMTVVIGIATIKAALIALVFMHLLDERKWFHVLLGVLAILMLVLLYWPGWDIGERLSR